MDVQIDQSAHYDLALAVIDAIALCGLDVGLDTFNSTINDSHIGHLGHAVVNDFSTFKYNLFAHIHLQKGRPNSRPIYQQ